MATYGAMKSRIARELNRDDIGDEISAAVQSSIEYYQRHPFTFNFKREALFMEPGERTPVPADMYDPYNLRVKVTPSHWDTLFPRAYSVLENLYTSPAVYGNPDLYAIFGGYIYVYPQIDATASAIFSYLYKVDAPINDADGNAWTTDAEELIRMRAESDLYEVVLRGKEAYEAANRIRLREAEQLNKLDTDFVKLYGINMVRNRSLLCGPRRYY